MACLERTPDPFRRSDQSAPFSAIFSDSPPISTPQGQSKAPTCSSAMGVYLNLEAGASIQAQSRPFSRPCYLFPASRPKGCGPSRMCRSEPPSATGLHLSPVAKMATRRHFPPYSFIYGPFATPARPSPRPYPRRYVKTTPNPRAASSVNLYPVAKKAARPHTWPFSRMCPPFSSSAAGLRP